MNHTSRSLGCGLVVALLDLAAPAEMNELPEAGARNSVTVVGRLVDAACFASGGDSFDAVDRWTARRIREARAVPKTPPRQHFRWHHSL
jgi:hypothetical protein